MRDPRPVIVVRRVEPRRSRRPHQGSWKVAYADFVTAMMAFFMVLWIVGLDPETKRAIEGYFSRPVGAEALRTPALGPGSPAAVSLAPVRLIARGYEQRRYEEIAQRIRAELDGPAGLGAAAGQVEVALTADGLRIELVEDGSGDLFFAFGSAELRPTAARALGTIAGGLREVSAPIVVEGHTDAAPFGSAGYSNWELSADRANAARRALERSGLGAGRVSGIRGYADRYLRLPDAPLDKSNRRISILLPYTAPPEVRQAVSDAVAGE